MRQRNVRRGALRLRIPVGVIAAAALLIAAVPAQATTISTSCTPAVEYQPFLPFLDGNWYVPLPGESYDNVDGTGWTLSGGAGLVTSSVWDSPSGSVLNLPKGAKAVSPATCVDNTYPYLRMMLSTVNSGTATLSISYLQTNGTWKSASSIGSLTTKTSAWALTSQSKIPTGPYSGWNLAELTLTNAGNKTGADTKVYNIYADPRMKH